jgi:hypothetical protein
LKKKKDQIEKEMTFIENKLIECDQIISYNNVEVNSKQISYIF